MQGKTTPTSSCWRTALLKRRELSEILVLLSSWQDDDLGKHRQKKQQPGQPEERVYQERNQQEAQNLLLSDQKGRRRKARNKVTPISYCSFTMYLIFMVTFEVMTKGCAAELHMASAAVQQDTCESNVHQHGTGGWISWGVLPREDPSTTVTAIIIEVLNMPFVGLFLLYVLVFMFGSYRNRSIATRWVNDVWPVLQHEFHCVGIPLRTTDELDAKDIARPFKSAVLQVESYRCFRLYASGRRNCMCCLIDLDLRPRQDCLSLLYGFFSEWKDVIFVDVPLVPATMEPFVFCILRRKDLAFVRDTMHDVAMLTRPVPLELLPNGLLCHTDCSELVAHFLSPNIVKALQVLQDYIELIHVSDQNTMSCFGPNQVHREALRFRFRLPKIAEHRCSLLSLIFQFVDLAATASLAPETRDAALQVRKKRPFTISTAATTTSTAKTSH